ncbi:MAG: glycosyl hydrolase [Ignavibacteriaceae bacterium]|nr:glycosyl hydrolase [Ignavibacteriaceae bacterium]
MKKLLILLALFIYFTPVIPQNKYPAPTQENERTSASEKRVKMYEESIFKNFEFESIGPTVFGARIVDLDVNPGNPKEMFIAYASGGLFYSKNNGNSFTPVFDFQATIIMGDIAVDWKNGTVFIGTGENNSSRSSYTGAGVYKSTDLGKTWNYSGLSGTHRTGRIIIDHSNPNNVWVAAAGALYSKNENRGIFKSSDGGKTWSKTLYIDDLTGVIDLIQDPFNANVLYAAAWYRSRTSWNFSDGSGNSGIYKTEDAGETWKKITNGDNGFPVNKFTGRIGLAISHKNPGVIYALLDNLETYEQERVKKIKIDKDDLINMKREDFLELSDEDIDEYLSNYGFPQEYNASKVKELVRNFRIVPRDLVTYLGDANRDLFDKPVKGAELYRSDNGGGTWVKTHDKPIKNMYFTYGYYFGEVRVSPQDDNIVYLLGVPILKSTDAGKTFYSVNRENVHVDHHSMWINPNDQDHLVLGNDGGLNISYDGGATYFTLNTPAVGQFYSISVDNAKPYNVYGGTQDNGVWKGPSNYKYSYRWYSTGDYPYKSLLGGDGMQTAIDSRNNNILYTGYQFGNYFRIDLSKGEYKQVKPYHKLGEPLLRFNWQTPIHLSVHNQDILYLGSNKLHRSMNKGDNFVEISTDLTKGAVEGNVPYGTLTAIHESPLKFGLIYTGSDDGLVHVTKDGGNTWSNITKGLPENYWVSRIKASAFDTSTVYLSLNGYRYDNNESLIYSSVDFGKTWKQIGKNLPKEPVNVIIEDPVNPDIIYCGTDFAIYLSLDKGEIFHNFNGTLPFVPVHDLVVHPTEGDLLAGTHGRSIFKVNIKKIQNLDPVTLTADLHMYDINPVNHSANWGVRGYDGSIYEPALKIEFFTKDGGDVSFSVRDSLNANLHNFTFKAGKGFNFVDYDLSFTPASTKEEPKDSGKFYLPIGKYGLTAELNGISIYKEFVIKGPVKAKRK